MFVATLGASEILVSVKRRFVGVLGVLVIRVSAKRLFKQSHRETYFLRGGGDITPVFITASAWRS